MGLALIRACSVTLEINLSVRSNLNGAETVTYAWVYTCGVHLENCMLPAAVLIEI